MKPLTLMIAAVLVSLTAAAAVIHWHIGSDEDTDIDRTMASVLEITCADSEAQTVAGTGFVIDRSGPCVITAAHVVTFAGDDSVRPYGEVSGRTANSSVSYSLSVSDYDSNMDLALLRFTDNAELKPLTLKSDRPPYGEKVVVPGNALGYGISVKEGVVSVPEIDVTVKGSVRNCIMVSVTLNNGDSGAPIVDGHGNVLGMASFGLREEGKSLVGMGFGITSKSILEFLDAVSADGRCRYRSDFPI